MSPLVLSLFAILVIVTAESPLLAPVVLAGSAPQPSAYASAEDNAHAEAGAYANGGNDDAVANPRHGNHRPISLNGRYDKCSSIIEGFVTDSISLQPTVQIPPHQNGTSLIYGNDCLKKLEPERKAGLQVTVCDLADRNRPVLILRSNEMVVASSSPSGYIVFSRQFCSHGHL